MEDVQQGVSTEASRCTHIRLLERRDHETEEMGERKEVSTPRRSQLCHVRENATHGTDE